MSKLKIIGSAILMVLVLGYVVYNIGKRQLTGYLLKHDSQRTRAVIVDEKNYWGNSPVSHEFSYSYTFYVKGEPYKGDSQNSSLQVGDSIDVEYVEHWPALNRPMSRAASRN